MNLIALIKHIAFTQSKELSLKEIKDIASVYCQQNNTKTLEQLINEAP